LGKTRITGSSEINEIEIVSDANMILRRKKDLFGGGKKLCPQKGQKRASSCRSHKEGRQAILVGQAAFVQDGEGEREKQ